MLGYFLPGLPYPFEGERTDCPVCGSSDHAQIGVLDRKLKRLSTDICHHCGLMFHNPMPTDAELSAYYASTYRFEYQFLRRRPSASHQARKAREAAGREAQIDAAADLSQPLRTLDFGCGSGELVRHLASQGHEAHGIEPGDSFAQHAAGEAGEATIHHGEWARMTFPAGHFNLITCLHVLEHLNRPVAALEQMREWLAPDGILFLEVPDMEGYSNKGFDRFHFAHTLGFSHDCLVLALERAGFAVMTERARTSLFAVKAGDPRANPAPLDLKGNAARMKAAYSQPFSLTRHVTRHAKRIRRILGHQIGAGK
ncbi:MAG: class I SAM-dependent methyltransferase [Pseudomonadota bacterium]